MGVLDLLPLPALQLSADGRLRAASRRADTLVPDVGAAAAWWPQVDGVQRLVDEAREHGHAEATLRLVTARRGPTRHLEVWIARQPDATLLALVNDATDDMVRAERDGVAATAFDAADEPMAILAPSAHVQRVNAAFVRVVARQEDVAGLKIDHLVPAEDSERLRRVIGAVLRQGRWRGEVRLRTRGGRPIPCWATFTAVRGDDDSVQHLLATFADIRELKRTEAHLDRLAHHDPLTGLANRLHLRQRLEALLGARRHTDRRVGVLFIDLDRFKAVNDTLGHDAGDELLRQVAGRLVSRVRSTDLVARTGGDEFVVVLPDLKADTDARHVAEDLRDRVGTPFQIGDHTAEIGASIGVAVCPRDGDRFEVLVARADAAMYAAKQQGRDAVVDVADAPAAQER